MNSTEFFNFKRLYAIALLGAFTIAASAFHALYIAEIFRSWLPFSGGPYFFTVYGGLILSLMAMAFSVRKAAIPALVFLCALAAPLFTEGLYPMTDISFFVLAAVIAAEFLSSAQGIRMFIWLTLGAIYFNAFLNKLYHDAGAWLDGSTLQAYMVARAHALDREWLLPLAHSQNACAALSIFTLIFEAGFIFAWFQPGLRRVFAGLGIIFHFAIYMLLDVNFMLFYLPAYLVFFHLEWPRKQNR